MRLHFCVLLLILLHGAGCKLFDAGYEGTGQTVVLVDDLASPKIAREAAEVRDARIEKAKLHLRASYSGGCADHEFVLYGTTGFGKSNPPTTAVRLGHDAKGDRCEAYVTQELTFELTRLLQAWRSTGQSGSIRLLVLPPHHDEPVAVLEVAL